MNPRLLDLFCGAGGAAMGYHRAGFEVVGIDIKWQPNYPFEFHQADALEPWDWVEMTGDEFDAIHASPPCQAHVVGLAEVNQTIGRTPEHREFIEETREMVQRGTVPYVIENVISAPLINPIQLCGSSFGLNVWRHRLFECSFPVMVFPCAHHLHREPKFWNGDRSARNPFGSTLPLVKAPS